MNKLRFVLPLRCGDCRTRFCANTLRLADLKWARCPQCMRTDLASWNREKVPPESPVDVVKSFLGAHLWRCEYCRRNFTSFRPRQEVFSFRRWQKMAAQDNKSGK